MELSWHVNKNFSVAVGADNVFNVYPDKFNAANNTSGLAQYSSFSPFGFDGGFYYGRGSFKVLSAFLTRSFQAGAKTPRPFL